MKSLRQGIHIVHVTKTHEAVHGRARLILNRSPLALAILDGAIYKVGILWFVRCGEQQRWVRRGILWVRIRMDATQSLRVDYLWFVHVNGYSPGRLAPCGE